MKMAMRDGQIFIREADNIQFTVIKSWGKMKWNRSVKELSGPADAELLNKLASLVTLPAPIDTERKRLNRIAEEVDRQRMDPEPVPLIKPPIKVKPYKHQIRGYNMALLVFGLVEPPERKNKEDDKK